MRSSTAFHLVRYGNVLASRGSVVPTLVAQVAAGLPITLTDPAMTRFWLTLDDAVDLVLRSLALPPGAIYVPACRSTTMGELAEAVAPGAQVQNIGGRGGEKQHESLVNEHEAPYARHAFGGWALDSLALAPANELAPFVYTSEYARRIPVPELADALRSIMAGEPVRLL
jgi:FlaA1/EpsC-like NDP-sugar epimerase